MCNTHHRRRLRLANAIGKRSLVWPPKLCRPHAVSLTRTWSQSLVSILKESTSLVQNRTIAGG